jgi:hypothetical protein
VRPVARVRPTIGAKGGDVVRVRAFSVLVVGVGLLGVLLLASLTQAGCGERPEPGCTGADLPDLQFEQLRQSDEHHQSVFPADPGRSLHIQRLPETAVGRRHRVRHEQDAEERRRQERRGS